MNFRGSYTVTITPFTAGTGAIDLDALASFLEWQVGSGVPGVIVLGTTGEYVTAREDERTAIVETTIAPSPAGSRSSSARPTSTRPVPCASPGGRAARRRRRHGPAAVLLHPDRR